MTPETPDPQLLVPLDMEYPQTSVFKYVFPYGENSFELVMPLGARVLTIQPQHGRGVLWALCHPHARKEKRRFVIYGTGTPLAAPDREVYIGTFQVCNGELVWHVFEILELPKKTYPYVVVDEGNVAVTNTGTFVVQAAIATGVSGPAKAEDTASATGDVGIAAMVIQRATPADTAADLDYSMLQKKTESNCLE